MPAADWTRDVLRPAPLPSRPRWLHWLAWFASILSFVLFMVPFFGAGLDKAPAWMRHADLWISVAFALEFFTRSGFRQQKWQYARWRLFDFLSMVPVVYIGGMTDLAAWFLWLVLLARLTRLADRTVGDGFVKRNALALLGAVEEEITDRVTLKIMARMESELARAEFGSTAAAAIGKHRERILGRIYEEQKPEAGAMAKLANITGLQTAVEKMEARIFDAVVNVIGSPETDAMIREVVKQSLGRARQEIGQRSWKSQVGLTPKSA